MTSPLLDAVEARAKENIYRTYVQRMREHLDHEDRKRALGRLIQHSGQFRFGATNCFWIEEPQERWLGVLQPSFATKKDAKAATESAVGGAPIQVFLYSEIAVVNAFSSALQFIKDIKPIRYLTLGVELEGHSIPVPAPWGTPLTNSAHGTLFASAESHLSSPAYTRESLKGGPQFGLQFEALPAQPRFKLNLHLIDPRLMYAAQRRRALLSMGLVATAASAALIGLAAAWRSFHRQLRLNEMKSNFVSSVSHELRAPIASVRLMAESLERGKISGEQKQGEYFRFIVQECRRLTSLIENVLDFSRIEQGRKQYEFEPTDLVALVQQTVKLMETYAAERQIKLALTIPDAQLPTLNSQPSVDDKAIQQALVNLMDNAIKHSPKGETVTVGL
jgi:signal transduction histidine kinase